MSLLYHHHWGEKYFFGQGRTITENIIHHTEILSTTVPVEPTKFGQEIKSSDQANCIKGSHEKYYKNISFGILTYTSSCDSLPRNNHVLCSIPTPEIKKITDNIYHYPPCHCANWVSQAKGINFDQSSSPVLSDYTICLVIDIASTYHPIIGISDVTNSFKNTPKDSTESNIINFSPHYTTWFKSRSPIIRIRPYPDR